MRTRSKDYDANIQHVLDRAATLFARDGFARTSVADIAKACGFSKSLIYHYFKSKEELLHGILAGHLKALLAMAEAVQASGGTPEQRLRRFCQDTVAIYMADRDRNLVLIHEMNCLPDEALEEVLDLERRFAVIVATLLEELNPAATRAGARTKPYAMLLFGMLNWTYAWYRPGGSLKPAMLADMIADLFMGGFTQLPLATAKSPVSATAPAGRRIA
jgi:AcrR family transcriptional regulator